MRSLYRASRVHTQAYPEAGEWLLVDGRHVQRVGRGEPPAADRVVDLPGTTIVPGFIDSHVHLTATGLAIGDRDVETARSAGQLLEAARRRAGEPDAAGPVLMLGFDESRWERPEVPTIDDLDAASERPLVVRRADGHLSLANRAAIEAAGVAELEGTDLGPGGQPTGRLTRRANDAIGSWAMSAIGDHRRQDLQLRAASLGAARGITAVHEMSMPHWHGETDLRVLLAHRARLPLDVAPIVATTDLGVAIDHGLPAIGGDLPVDGSIGASTAWVGEPYVDGGTGVGYLGGDDLVEFLLGGHSSGLQVGVHAIGDRAIEEVLAGWERVYHGLSSRERRHFRARRHRIEHLEMVSMDQIERAAMLGLAASVQPAFDAVWGGPGGLYERRLGRERAAAMNPLRSMVERGIEVGVGSDAPITSIDPMRAIQAIERHHDTHQRLPRRAAIRLHTIGSARLGHQELKKGSLAPGMHADFAAFEADPFDEPSLEELRPVLTVSLGREVFAA